MEVAEIPKIIVTQPSGVVVVQEQGEKIVSQVSVGHTATSQVIYCMLYFFLALAVWVNGLWIRAMK